MAYALPAASVGYLGLLVGIYLFKFSTDVLLIAPGVMGTVFLLARVWDAVSDPLAGYLSDRTRTRLGRRRPWLLGAALPMVLVAAMPWTPPAGLQGAMLVAWVTVGLLLFETAATAFHVPHAALGAELSMDHHERSRVFASRHLATGAGFILVTAALGWMTHADDKRLAGLVLSMGGGLLSSLLILLAVRRLRERAEHVGRGGERPFRAVGDVWRNPHARLLLGVFLIESLGAATLGILGAYLTQYVFGDESLFPLLLVGYFGASLLVVPAVLPISRRLGKKRTWAAGMLVTALGFLLLFFGSPERIWIVFLAAVGAGIGGGIGNMMGPSVQADVIDWDEYTTGERKEGTYFAVWNFTRKCAGGLMGWLTGMTLQWVGFSPNQEQTEATLFAIRGLAGLFPAAAYGIGALLFFRFRLDEAEHRRIRAELETRAGGRG